MVMSPFTMICRKLPPDEEYRLLVPDPPLGISTRSTPSRSFHRSCEPSSFCTFPFRLCSIEILKWSICIVVLAFAHAGTHPCAISSQSHNLHSCSGQCMQTPHSLSCPFPSISIQVRLCICRLRYAIAHFTFSIRFFFHVPTVLQVFATSEHTGFGICNRERGVTRQATRKRKA